MKITFIGQLGLPTRLAKAPAKRAGQAGLPDWQDSANSREKRASALAQLLATAGHEVNILGTAPHLVSGTWQGVRLISKPSLDPTRPGGFLYHALCVWHVVRNQPNVVHVQGWTAAGLLRLASFLIPRTTRVLTIDYLPRSSNRLVRIFLRSSTKTFTRLTTPTRQLQYRLLTEFGLRVSYVPDGFGEITTTLLPVARWRLQENKYVVVLSKSIPKIRQLAKIYRAAGLKLKLVVLHENQGFLKRLTRQNPLVKTVGNLRGRSQRSVLAQAAAVILLDGATSVQTLLETMAAGRPIIAITDPTYQETLGVTGQFVKPGAPADIVNILAALASNAKLSAHWGRLAKKRAQRHFTWDHILEEYLNAYHALDHVLVPLDSAHLVSFTQATEAVQ